MADEEKKRKAKTDAEETSEGPADEKPVKEEEVKTRQEEGFDIVVWKPKTSLGMAIKEGKITDIAKVLESGKKIQEAEIIDALVPDLESDLLLIGQSKGKFGGGQRRVFKQTQKKTNEGNKPRFATMAVVGNRNGYVGVGYGKAKETVPAREKAVRNAKLSLMKVRRGCGSWQCQCRSPHSIPLAVEGKCGSSVIRIMPAPKGTGLKIEKECAKILELAGIKDIYSRTEGQTKTKVNLVYACMKALGNLNRTRIPHQYHQDQNIAEGPLREAGRDGPADDDGTAEE
ncbi:30S ribosomal protein S5 [Candidatus Woesearchaeota archaeon]|nr:30S ribosomal protein S5 [Candidatus Woesearchaeota archaeon]